VALLNSVSKWGAPAVALVLAAAPLAQIYAQDSGSVQAGDPAKGKPLFEGAVCSACHTLAAANASGPIGPSLDHNPNLTHAYIVNRVSNGNGAMPPYLGQFSEEQINDLAAYVLSVAEKPN
jgi:mono/diheme cytochrome c family protein